LSAAYFLKDTHDITLFEKSDRLGGHSRTIEIKTQEECIAIVSYWSKPYAKLTIDNERKIRETCQQTHEKLVQKIGKSIAPILKNIMPYWILAQADSFLSSARIAESAFKSTFNQEKQPEVVRFAKDEITNVIFYLYWLKFSISK
jgi:protoporphyrinogen oxidase